MLCFRILNIQPEDSGEYMCRARNQFGQSDPLIHTIIVEDGRPALPPTQVSPPEITAADTAEIGKTVSSFTQLSSNLMQLI